MTTLYYMPGACSLAPHIVLEWTGAPFETKRVRREAPELLAVNPAGAVPVLVEDDDWTLTQAGAILDYLAHKHPEADLLGGQGLRADAERHRWSSFITGDLHPAFVPIFAPARYTSDASAEAQQAVKTAAQALVRKRLELLDSHLATREWILDRRSIIDAYVFPMIRWASGVLPGGVADLRHVMALHDRLAADAGVQKALAREAA